MKKSLLFFFALFSLQLALSGHVFSQSDDQWLRKQQKLYLLKDKKEINRILKEVDERSGSLEKRMKLIAFLRIGTPYSMGCLGEEKPPDDGPLFRLDVTDCTVLVLTTLALAHSTTYDKAKEMMKSLNYYNPPAPGNEVVSYNNRLHFTYERLHRCPYFKDITEELLPLGKLKEATVTLNRKSDGSRLLNIPWEKKVTAYYIPCSEVTSSFALKLPSACGIGFVREKNFNLGLVVSHEGMVFDGAWLIEADSISKRVKKWGFLEYIRNNSDYFDGIVISRFL